jgi:hypothetical protein
VVVAAGLDLDLGLDALEERRLGMEDEPVRAGLDLGEVAVSRSATSSSPRKSWTRTPRAGTPRPVSRTCVEITRAFFR